MALQLDSVTRDWLGELRVARSPWRIRGRAAGETVVDAPEALLVWEPRRVTPVYAVPEAAVLRPVLDGGGPRALTPGEQHRPVLDPGVPFAAHTAVGRTASIRTGTGQEVAAFRFDDPLLAGHLAIDFAALRWFEEDLEQPSHPHDPFHRIDVRPVDAHVVMRLDDAVVVDTTHAKRLAETHLPLRWYVPPEDVRVPLEPSDTVTWCAYKGRATYRSARIADRRLDDLFWTYEEPLPDGRDVAGLLGVYSEHLDVTVGPPAPAAATLGG